MWINSKIVVFMAHSISNFLSVCCLPLFGAALVLLAIEHLEKAGRSSGHNGRQSAIGTESVELFRMAAPSLTDKFRKVKIARCGTWMLETGSIGFGFC